MNIAILGWGSLIWDSRKDFDQWCGAWLLDGPLLKVEFSRISKTSRPGALTLVIDPTNGSTVQVSYCCSKRDKLEDAIEDLRLREGIPKIKDGSLPRSIGRIDRAGHSSSCRDKEAHDTISIWADRKNLDSVIWTDLPSNFEEVCGEEFSVPAAIKHLRGLEGLGRTTAIAYIRQAPKFVQTELRKALQAESWFMQEQ